MTCCSFVFRRKNNSRNQIVQNDGDFPGIGNVKTYSYKELRNATKNFCPGNMVGRGAFGTVYRGRLKDGLVVAIKLLSSESRQGAKEFLNELSIISNVAHQNLVKLHGCCIDGDRRILVYSYHENNSLAQTLLGSSHSSIQFNWRTRVNICVGVARGLAFLHEEVQPYIVHRDIKASNVLLDKDLTPKISDFGLAKLFPSSMTHVSTKVAGTLGYLAPEYAIRGQLTRKADIYSFGVLVLEIVSGRCNTNTRLPPDDQFLLERVWTFYERGELVSIVDASLNGDFNADQACRFLKIGLMCTQDTPKTRPAMSMVVRMMRGECAISDNIMKPGLISDVMDLKVRTHEAIELNMTPTIALSALESSTSHALTTSTTTDDSY